MATGIDFTSSKPLGDDIITTVQLFRAAIARLHQVKGRCAEAIGASAQRMADLSGVENLGQAQQLSDRIHNLLAAIDDPNNTEFGKLRDFIYAINK